MKLRGLKNQMQVRDVELFFAPSYIHHVALPLPFHALSVTTALLRPLVMSNQSRRKLYRDPKTFEIGAVSDVRRWNTVHMYTQSRNRKPSCLRMIRMLPLCLNLRLAVQDHYQISENSANRA
jgi:hypothetical protein